MLNNNFLTVDLTMFGEIGEAAVSGDLGTGQVAAVRGNANSADGTGSKGDTKCTSGANGTNDAYSQNGASSAAAVSKNVSANSGGLPNVNSVSVESALTEQQLRKKQSEFDKLIKGEYKKQYERNVQNIINQRFKRAKENEERLKAFEQLGAALGELYGVNPNDVTSLQNALHSQLGEKSYSDTHSSENSDTEREEKRIRARREHELMLHSGARRLHDEWLESAANLKAVYPQLDLAAECGNGRFLQLLALGFDVKTAYEAVHHNEIVESAVAEASRAASEKVVRSIEARGQRPSENGTSGGGGVVIKRAVGKMSGGEIDAILRRVEKGERIVL